MTTTTPTALDTPYDLAPERIAAFERDGFVQLGGVLDPSVVAGYEPEITAKVIELNTMHLPMAEGSTYNKAFLQVGNLWQHSERVRELVYSRRLARIAAELLGVDGVRLYHDQALYKEPGGGITPWHADQYYWPLANDRCCTIWLPLQETPLEMGPLEFAAGSHRFEYGRDLPISDESEAALQVALAEQDLPVVNEPFALGDASFHLGWTFHHAGPNTAADPRRVMTVIYIDADMVAAEPVNEHQVGNLAASLPGVRPGEVAASPLNPVLYRR
ncbi:phytanoyl-CoA dioxygenase family protein [Jiangella mangrovi]|uniref:Ectoine hydroxylase-related dioxygenase (Phytanoyl-CoA dioxygenase family) n=1 Tax=Jiangella mangrovi TaxID=1524084 RepID=A0A7W9LJV6_9ACTN|nr:phytanoyl-CoA dioxygenase family protein [Jiangella mangrovi]MBB5786461.1 ectoine hydroxylase-related dioxygenase (phytanoyl-CoA dioxygenase family) [Jiangella mangrovi]